MGVSARIAGYGKALSSENVTSIGNVTAKGLASIPSGAAAALITVEGQPVRWRADGNDPTASVGHYIAVDGNLEVGRHDLAAIKFIATTGTASVFVTYFKDV